MHLNYINSELTQVALMASAMSRTPLLLIGNPGCGKSAISREFLAGHFDSDQINISCSAYTRDDDVLGGLVLDDAVKGINNRNLDMGICNKKGFLLDEFFKVIDPSLQSSLLPVLEPKPWIMNKGQKTYLDYECGILTSNWDDLEQANANTSPFWDRLVIKSAVDDLSQKENIDFLGELLGVKRGGKESPKVYQYATEDIQKARKAALKISVGEQALANIEQVLGRASNLKLNISTRKLTSIVKSVHPNTPSLAQSFQYLIHGQSSTVCGEIAQILLTLSSWTDKEYGIKYSKAARDYIVGNCKRQSDWEQNFVAFLSSLERGEKPSAYECQLVNEYYKDKRFNQLSAETRQRAYQVMTAIAEYANDSEDDEDDIAF